MIARKAGRKLLGATTALLLVTACAAPAADDSGGKDPAATTPAASGGSANEGYGRTVGEGALFGGAVGGLLGWLIDDEDGALVGAAIGAGAGAIAGVVVAEVQEDYAEREDQLEALLFGIRSSNSDARQVVGEMREVVEIDRARLEAARQQYEDGEIQEYLLQREVDRVQRHQDAIASATRDARETYEGYRQARVVVSEGGAGEPLSAEEQQDLIAIDQELVQLQQQVNLMAQITSELAEPA